MKTERKPNLDNVLHILRTNAPYLRDKYHVSRLGVFGSVARGEQTPDSDVDVLVEFHKVPDLFGFVGLADDIENLLHNKIDLVTRGSIRDGYWDYIKNDVVYV